MATRRRPDAHDAAQLDPDTADPLAGPVVRGRASAANQRTVVRRYLKWLVLFDVVLVVVIGAVWLTFGDELKRGSELRGSLPPSGQSTPDLSGIEGVQPPVPSPEELAGQPHLVVGTCLDCRSADVWGQVLARVLDEDLPDDARIVVLGWDGDAGSWASRWDLDGSGDALTVHGAGSGDDADAVRSALRIGESGIAFVHGSDGTWRSSFHLGQAAPDDIVHDLRAAG